VVLLPPGLGSRAITVYFKRGYVRYRPPLGREGRKEGGREGGRGEGRKEREKEGVGQAEKSSL